MIIAHHLIITAYGWWLPNDPRGSSSQVVACDVINQLGQLHQGRCHPQPPSPKIREFYNRAQGALKYPLLEFSPTDTRIIADGIAQSISESRYTCYACAIMPDHVHLTIRKHKDNADQMIENFQKYCRLRLSSLGSRQPDHPVWARSGWKVYLFDPEDIRRTIRYVRENPLKRRMPAQDWPFVTEYDGWPLHPGHNPNSPYAKRLQQRGR
jgi:REP element-mobilizing transposase RayT